jgi:hypothetical protein
MSRTIVIVLALLSFSVTSHAITEEKEEEMGILLNAISVCSKEEPQKCASFIKRNLNKVRTRKIHDRLLLWYADSLFRMGNTTQLREVVAQINAENLTGKELKKLKLIENYLILLENPQKALEEFLKNWNDFILVIPPEKLAVYVGQSVKTGNCEIGLKFVSHLLSVYPDFVLTPKGVFRVAMCFYRRGKFEKAFRLFYRIHLLYPTFKPRLVKMYLIHTSLLTGEKIKVVTNPENFLFNLTISPPSKDAFRIYLDYLTMKYKILNHELFIKGIRTVKIARSYKVNLNKYVTLLFNLHIPYEFKKKNEKEIVYLFYNLKRLFGLDLKQLSEEGRSYLFASLVDFLSYEDAKKVKSSGKIKYSLIPNQTVMYYTFFKLKNIPEEAFNSPELNTFLKLIYLLKVKKDLKIAKEVFFKAIEEKEDLNSLPLYLSKFKEADIIKFYKGIEKRDPEGNNYLNYIFYEVLLYRNGKYDSIKSRQDILYQLNMVADEESLPIVDYLQFAVKRREKSLDITNIRRWMLKIRRELASATR